MTTLEPSLVPVKTVMVMLPPVLTMLLFLMVESKLSPTMSMMLMVDTSLMFLTLEKPCTPNTNPNLTSPPLTQPHTTPPQLLTTQPLITVRAYLNDATTGHAIV